MSIDQLISQHFDELNTTEKNIWNYIHQHKADCQQMSIAQLATCCNVSHTTILRFAQKLGLQGYSELKVYLRLSISEQADFDEDVLEDTCFDYEQLMRSMKEKDCSNIFAMMNQANRIFVYGTGEVQKNVAKELQRIFINAQKVIYHIEGFDETGIVTQYMDEHDMIFIISLSGSSNIVKRFVEKLKVCNVKIVSITRLEQNELAQYADESLFINTRFHNTGKGVQVYSSMTSFFMMIDLLFLKYLRYQAQREHG